MAMDKVIVVEAPKKVATLSKILGAGYKVVATGGHIKDLPPDKLAVDVQEGFSVIYSLLPRKEATFRTLKDLKGNDVLICTDADREGERIGAHVADIMGIPLDRICRATYGNLSESAVLAAMKAPRAFDRNLLDAQECRRIVDRLMGYMTSKWLWKMGDLMHVRDLKAAGRVQSAVLNLLVKREEEIEAFVPQTHYLLKLKRMAELLRKDTLEGVQVIKVGERYEDVKYLSLLDINLALEEFKQRRGPMVLEDSSERSDDVHAPPALITSTLIKQASTTLGLAPDKIMTAAQALYASGYISYIRTDNPNVSEEFVVLAKQRFVAAGAGGLLASKVKTYKAPEGAQEAHEAIRPTDPSMPLEKLPEDQRDVYKVILLRSLLCLCSPAKVKKMAAIYRCGGLLFKFPTLEIESRGWYDFPAMFPELRDLFNKLFSPPKPTCLGELSDLVPLQYPVTSQCPPRYTVATLTDEMEKLEIGRPSTYVAVFVTLDRHRYIGYTKQKSIVPTDAGRQVTRLLRVSFQPFIEPDYTRKIEKELDEVAAGRLSRETFLNLWYHEFVGYHDTAMASVTQMLSARPAVPVV